MSRMTWRSVGVAMAVMCSVSIARAQQTRGPDKIDEAYTKRIAETLRDKRITTEYVDYLPASTTVPTPLKFFGHIIGEFGTLDRARR